MTRYLKAILLAAALIPAGGLFAQDVALHGFVQVNHALRIADTDGSVNGRGEPWPDYLLGDERIQLELTRFGSNAGLLGKVDFYYDSIAKRADIEIREAYVDVQWGTFDIRAGRQIITWGVGDLVFINDVFPKDWVAFLSGRPLEYLKFGSDALSVNVFDEAISAQAVVIPFYQPDILPTGERLTAYNPFPAATGRIERLPENRLKNTQWALRLYRYLGNYVVSLYGYRGFYPSPPGMDFDPDTGLVTVFHPRLNVYGASIQGAFLNGVLSLEGGYYDSRDDTDGTNPAIENAQVRLLAGYQRAFTENLTVGVQYYGEHIQKHAQYAATLPPGFPLRKEWRHTLSVRLTQLMQYQTVRLSFFTFYSPNEDDYYVNPEVQYELSDGVRLAAGSLLLGGERESTFFGQFEKNDNVYVVLRYAF
ncbi:MAG: DUF1302 family protein [Rhodothermales bacterium]